MGTSKIEWTNMTWNSVSTPPEEGTIVDVLFDPNTAEHGMIYFYCPEYEETKLPRITSVCRKGIYWYTAFGKIPIMSVTPIYWMHQPKLPKDFPV